MWNIVWSWGFCTLTQITHDMSRCDPGSWTKFFPICTFCVSCWAHWMLKHAASRVPQHPPRLATTSTPGLTEERQVIGYETTNYITVVVEWSLHNQSSCRPNRRIGGTNQQIAKFKAHGMNPPRRQGYCSTTSGFWVGVLQVARANRAGLAGLAKGAGSWRHNAMGNAGQLGFACPAMQTHGRYQRQNARVFLPAPIC